MKITKLNYEAFAIDYLEGMLSVKDKNAFDQFLISHPEIKSELNDYLAAPLLPEDSTILYADKNQHLKSKSLKTLWFLGLIMAGIAIVSLLFYNKSSAELIQHLPNLLNTEHLAQLNTTDNNSPLLNINPYKTSSTQAHLNPTHKSDQPIVMKTALTNENKKIGRPATPPIENRSIIMAQSTVHQKNITIQKKILTQISGQQIPTPSENIVLLDIPHSTSPNIYAKQTALATLGHMPTLLLTSMNSSLRQLKFRSTITSSVDIDITNPIVSEHEKNQEKLWRLFVPKAYKDIDLKNVFAAQNIKPNTNLQLLPQNYLTK